MKNPINRRTFVKQASLGGLALGFAPSLVAQNGYLLETDVCILGAGASGMFMADRLRDLGYSVVLLEKAKQVGGHAQTYRKSGKSGHLDMGVRIYPNDPLIKDMLQKYGVEFDRFSLRGANQATLFDYESNALSPTKMPGALKILRSMLRYEKVYQKNFSFLEEPGLAIPSDLPEEVLMPFGEYLKKYNLDRNFAPMINYLQGFGKVAEVPTFYALKNLRPTITQNARKNSFIAPLAGVDQMYRNMAKAFGEDIIQGVSSFRVKRYEGDNAVIELETEQGAAKLKAKHIVVSIPPVMQNMKAFDLDSQEKGLFSKFKYNQYRTVALEVEGLPDKVALMNAGKEGFLTAMNEKGMYLTASSSIEGIYNVLHGTDATHGITNEEALDEIVGKVEGLSKFYNRKVKVKDVGLFLSHTPYMVHVSPDEIREGFYNQMDAMQGRRNTYYVGAAMSTHGTFATWQHAETILKRFFKEKVSMR